MNSSHIGVVSFPFQLSGFSWCLICTLQCPTDDLADFMVFSVHDPDVSKILPNKFLPGKAYLQKKFKVKREIVWEQEHFFSFFGCNIYSSLTLIIKPFST